MNAAALARMPTTTLVKMALGAKLKELFMPKPPGFWGSFLVGLSRTDHNYSAEVGDGLSSSVVSPIIHWIQRAFPEAPLVVRERRGDELQIVEGHPLQQLIERPNPFYPGTLLWMVTLSDWAWFGESYWRILYQRGGAPGELWWLPPWSIQPKWPVDGSEFVSYYEYTPDGGTPIPLELTEVLHFRHGLDPKNPRHGLPPLRAMMREIWSDAESANWVASLLRNMGIPGMILSPKGESASMSPEDVERIKAYVMGRFTGDHRGEPLAFGAPTQVDRLSWSPKELDLTVVRNTAEERVSAALGIPAAVVGYHAGLDSSKVGATMREFVRLAWANGIIPVQRLMADELQRVLLPQFETNPETFLVGWNYDEVEVLQESRDELAKRYAILYDAGILMRSECRDAQGYESIKEDEVYKKALGVELIGPGAPEPDPLPALPPANGASNGNRARNGAVAEQRDLHLKQGSLDEWLTAMIGRHAQRFDTPPAALKRLATRQLRALQRLQPPLETRMVEVLRRYGDAAKTAAKEILRPDKQSLEDVVRAAIISERIPMLSIRADLTAVYERMYIEIAELMVKLSQEAINVEPMDLARVRNQLRLLAQNRTGLLDLDGEARSAILRSLDEARTQGLDEDAQIELIRERVPSGRWTSPEMRAQIMVRTEGRMAAMATASETAQQLGGRILILDALLGPTDEECMIRHGWVVNPAEARQLASVEHVNGTMMQLVVSPTTALSGTGT